MPDSGPTRHAAPGLSFMPLGFWASRPLHFAALCRRSPSTYAALRHSRKLPFVSRRSKHPAKMVALRTERTFDAPTISSL